MVTRRSVGVLRPSTGWCSRPTLLQIPTCPLLRSRRSRRSPLVLRHGGVHDPAGQPHLGLGAVSLGHQRGHRQVDFPPQVHVRRLAGLVEGPLGPSGFHLAPWSGLRRDLQSRRQVRNRSDRPLPGLDGPLAGRQECLPPWHSNQDGVLLPARRLRQLRLLGSGLQAELLHVWPQGGTTGLAQLLHLLLGLTRLRRGQVGHVPIHPSTQRRHRLPLYVDDIVLVTPSAALLQHNIAALQREFTMKDLSLSTNSSGSPWSNAPRASSSTSANTPSTFWSGLTCLTTSLAPRLSTLRRISDNDGPVYHCRWQATASTPADLAPSTSVACFTDPGLIYHHHEWDSSSAPDAPPTRIEPPVYHPIAIHCDPVHVHPMVTRHTAGFLCPVDRLILVANTTTAPPDASPVPSSVRATIADPTGVMLWRSTRPYWPTTPRTWCRCPLGTKVVTGKWIFRHKITSDGSLDRYKAHWVFWGFTQRPVVDYDETFSPVVKFATVRAVLPRPLPGLGDPSASCQECLPPRQSDGDCLL
jgi:hypothetical protein